MTERTHFQKLMESMLDETNKSFGKFRGGAPEVPSNLSQKGRANPSIKRSRDHGFTVIKANYRKALVGFVEDWLKAKNMAPSVFKREATEIIRSYFNKAFRYGMLSKAGIKASSTTFPLSQGHFTWLTKASDEELSYLSQFVKDTRAGKNKLHYLARIDLYVNTLDSIFDAGLVAATPSDGYHLIYWKLNPGESCEGCIYLSERSPFTRDNLPTTPRSGHTPCLCIVDPDALILTKRGNIKIVDVVVGDEVMTHEFRWRKVLSTPRNFSDGHSLSDVGGVLCTSDHRWMTDNGWVDSINLYKNKLQVYNSHYVIHLYRMFESIFRGKIKKWSLQALSFCVPHLRFLERLQSRGMSFLWEKNQSNTAMGGPKEKGEAGIITSLYNGKEEKEISRFALSSFQSTSNRWASDFLLLGFDWEEVFVPVTLGMGNEMQRGISDSNWVSFTPQRWEFHQRFSRKFGTEVNIRASERSHDPRTSEVDDKGEGLRSKWCSIIRLSEMWEAIRRVFSRIKSKSTTEVLLLGVLEDGTPLYDLEVEEDHSFIVNGLISHNSNCNCELEVKKVSEEEYNRVVSTQLDKHTLQKSLTRIKDRKVGTRKN